MFEFIKRLCGYKSASTAGFEKSVSLREARDLKIEPKWTKSEPKIKVARSTHINAMASSNVNRGLKHIGGCISENEALKMPLHSLYELLNGEHNPGRFAKRAFIRRMMREYKRKFGEYPDANKFHLFHAKLFYEDIHGIPLSPTN